jgi:hypothetical protein
MYSTTSMLRTIELILGLPPMSQFDAAATPMYRCFTQNVDTKSFTKRKNGVNLNEMNIVVSTNSMKSSKMDFSKPDLINDLELSKIVWQSVKGLDSEMPAPKRSAFLRITDTEDEDE